MTDQMKRLMSRTEFDGRLILLYALNVSDYLFTLVLISSGLFVEANPLMIPCIGNISGFMIKCILPLALLMTVHIRLCLHGTKYPAAVRMLLNGIIVYYGAINAMHVFWLSYTVVMFM